MKKALGWLIVVMLSLSIISVFSLVGCKEEAVEDVEEVAEEVEEVVEEAEEAVEEVEEVEEEAVEEVEIEELIIGVDEDLSTLDIQAARGNIGLQMGALFYNGLTALDENGNVVPGLAKDWDISEDGLEYTFYLQEGVKYHNGKEFVADDVKFSIERYLTPEVGFPFVTDFEKIEEIEIIDDYTIKFKLSGKYSPFLSGLASGLRGMVCPDAYSDDEIPEFLGTPIGTGPYKFTEWSTGNYLKMEANEDYWAGAPTVKNITFKIIPDASVRITALKTGDIDICMRPALSLISNELKEPSSDEYKFVTIPGSINSAHRFCFNTIGSTNDDERGAIFDDVRMRRAVQMTLDPQEINDAIFDGLAETADDIYAEDTFWDVDVERVPQDIEKAKELMAEAGYPDGVTIDMFAAEPSNIAKVTEVVQAQLAEIGMDVNIEVLEWSAWLQAGRDWGKNKYDACLYIGSLFTDPNSLYGLAFHSEGRSNWWIGWWNTPETDAILEEAVEVTDPEKRKELYTELFEIMQEEAADVWLTLDPLAYGYRTDFIGVEFHYRGDFEYNNNEGIPWILKKK
jgi:peptide/nickel transport system substrate-binding protein